MERALDPELLRLALGQHDTLPSAEQLSALIAQAELTLLIGHPEIDDGLISTAWYLHATASSKLALSKYGLPRQRAAFRVSAHIFDLINKNRPLDRPERLKICFASQVAYLRSELDPNAIAMYYQEASGNLPPQLGLVSDMTDVALSCGVAFLGFDVGYIYRVTKAVRQEIHSLIAEWKVEDIFSTPYGAAAGIALAVRDLTTALVYGRNNLLEGARQILRRAVSSEASMDDQVSRWVAAHLLNLIDELVSSSIWTILPEEISPSVKRAFALGRPRVLTLWPPQIDLIKPSAPNELSPLSLAVKRLFLATPTSSGKTLIAQLLIASHLSSQQTSIYYVAPTRSLCREVRVALASRLSFLGCEVTNDLPEGDWLDELVTSDPHVEVMTPERLSYLLRSDSARVLREVGMFIFDEVHNLGEQNRGWTLEQDLTFLHFATKATDHRLVLMSAAVGNRNHFVQWMGGDKVLHRSSEWRGPRRVCAIYRTEPDWESSAESAIRSAKFVKRITHPMYGRLDVRISPLGKDFYLRTSKPIGDLTFKLAADHSKTKDDAKSTPFYRMLVPLIRHLAHSGSVLVIEPTRPETVRMAKAIAELETVVDTPRLRTLLEHARARLGPNHPLLEVIPKGVAYHHSSLPHEIRVAIEEAVTLGDIHYLVATTTMTEGVNLPVKSVVVAAQGTHNSEGYVEYITGSRLLNAIGRAGRATRETEGVVVLARQAAATSEDFDRLQPPDSDLHVSSALATKEALEALATFEEMQRSFEDVVLQIASGIVSEFISFTWFVANQLEIAHGSVDLAQMRAVLQCSLAWVQLAEEDRKRWLSLTDLVTEQYQVTEAASRRRWATAGTSISSASRIERIARALAKAISDTGIPERPNEVIELIFGNGRIEQILSLPESPRKLIYAQRSGKNRPMISVLMDRLLTEWIGGSELVVIAEDNFALIPDVDYRFEQMGDFIYDYFEVFLPWALGTIIAWTNQFLSEAGVLKLLPTTLPAYVRWGVGTVPALELMSMGMASRTLATRIADRWLAEKLETPLVDWLKTLEAKEWQAFFSASLAEVELLLNFCRNQKGGASVELVNNGAASISVAAKSQDFPKSAATVGPIEGGELATLGIWVQGQLVGQILSKDQADIGTLQSSGLEITMAYSAAEGKGTLEMELANLDA